MRREVADAALIERQQALECEAAELMGEPAIEETLARMGPVLEVGSAAFTGLMVWRDLHVVVDAGEASVSAAFEAVLPLLGWSRAARYERQSDPRRHYFMQRRSPSRRGDARRPRRLPVRPVHADPRRLTRRRTGGII